MLLLFMPKYVGKIVLDLIQLQVTLPRILFTVSFFIFSNLSANLMKCCRNRFLQIWSMTPLIRSPHFDESAKRFFVEPKNRFLYKLKPVTTTTTTTIARTKPIQYLVDLNRIAFTAA